MHDPQSATEPSTLVDMLRDRAARQPQQLAYRYLLDGEVEELCVTYQELDRQARTIAAALQSLAPAGERAILLYPAGLEFIAAFFGCLYAGMVAVPAYPPDHTRLDRVLPRLQAIGGDAAAVVTLTTQSVRTFLDPSGRDGSQLARMRWLSTDTLETGSERTWREPAARADDLALLQYTSGSTGLPRGVMLSHAQILANQRMIRYGCGHDERTIYLSWLPLQHDMGLIGNVLQAAYLGVSCTLLSPAHFLKRPLRWLQAISRYRATTSGGPNFAYELCVRKTTPQERATLDLSHWTVAFNAAEPVRSATMKRFAEAFGPCGFRMESFYPAYGLAEAALVVSGGTRGRLPVERTVARAALAKNSVAPSPPGAAESVPVVGCGTALLNEQILVVDPASRHPCAADQVGEIWVAGPSVALGYWRKPAETAETFGARRADTGEGPFLRTGDLGFLQDGELFITGRLKDLIVIRGDNYYPQDIEQTIDRSHQQVPPGCNAAVALERDGEERLAIIQEVNVEVPRDYPALMASIRRVVADYHDLQVAVIALIPPRTIPKTTSGKIRRAACRDALLEGKLELLALWHDPFTTAMIHGAGRGRPPADLAERVWEVVRQVAGDRAQGFTMESAISELGLDSVERVELFTSIESRLQICLPDEVLTEVRTMGDLVARAASVLNGRSETPQGSVRALHRR